MANICSNNYFQTLVKKINLLPLLFSSRPPCPTPPQIIRRLRRRSRYPREQPTRLHERALSPPPQEPLLCTTTHRTAVQGRPDERAVVIRHLFVIGAQETQGLLVVARGGVMPGHGLEAVVGDVLVSWRTQEPQESHLNHSDGVAVSVHVGELRRSGKGDQEVADQGKRWWASRKFTPKCTSYHKVCHSIVGPPWGGSERTL